MIDKQCLRCNSSFSPIQEIDGKKRHLYNRKFCLQCSPFGEHNNRDLVKLDKNFQELDGILSKICTKCKIFKPLNSENFPTSRKSFSSWCRVCTNKDGNRKRIGMKNQAIIERGGACQKCGYSKCIAALEFHHLDSQAKSMRRTGMKNLREEEFRAEIEKCILICSNCHREIHWLESN